MEEFKDERFKHIIRDPKFRNVPKKEKKVTIDKRFQSMFTDDKFKLKYSVDSRGRPIRHSQADDLRKYYDLDETDDEEEASGDEDDLKIDERDNDEKVDEIWPSKPTVEESDINLEENIDEKSKINEKVWERLKDMTVDYARGDGLLETDSSSSDEPCSEDSEEAIEHDWGELDKDAEQTEEVTKRLAVCHMDWDRVTATDIMVLLHSFLPQTGFIKCVTVYPSEFGLERMKDEEIKGPKELTNKVLSSDEEKEDSHQDDFYHKEKLRQYQLNRLKYFYAVVEFDSCESANEVYTQCDRMEYESSATRMDLRFIPDDMSFDQEPREVCSSLPEASKYKPRLFVNSALQQEKVHLTWDETDPNRVEFTGKLASGEHVSEADLKEYIASSSGGSEDDENYNKDKGINEDGNNETESNNQDEINKYRSLLVGLQKKDEEKKTGKVEMEITWDLALENKTKNVEKQNKADKKKKNVKEESDNDNLLSDDDVPSDIDINDPYFKEEFEDNLPKKKKNKKGKKKNLWDVEDIDEDEQDRKKAELELVLADEKEEDKSKRHFSLKKIQEKESKKKGKGKKRDVTVEQDDFKIDLKDDRFKALFSSHLYNIDPADSHFRKTKAMDDIIAEKSKRRTNSDVYEPASKKQKKNNQQISCEVSRLLDSVKKKSNMNKI